jgi:beta-galactosidase
VTATYATGHLAGRPALLRNAVGEGQVHYIGTRLPAPALRDTLLSAIADAGVRPLLDGAPEHVEATRRTTPDADYLFLLNHSDTDAAEIPLPAPAHDLLTGDPVTGSLTLAPLAIAVLRTT